MEFTPEDVGKLFTTDGNEVLRLIRIDKVECYILKNLESGNEFKWPEDNLMKMKRLVPEVPKRKYKRKKDVLQNAPRQTTEDGDVMQNGVPDSEIREAEKIIGDLMARKVDSNVEVADILKQVADAGIPEIEIQRYILAEFKIRGRTLERSLKLLSPNDRPAVKLEIERRAKE